MTEYHEIPREFYSEFTGEPFAQCIDCEAELLVPGRVYSVIKQVVGTEVVFEMAICWTCQQRLQEQYSEQSRRNIEEFYIEALAKRHTDASTSPTTAAHHAHAPEPKQPTPLDDPADPTDPARQPAEVAPPSGEKHSEDLLSACGFCGRSRLDIHRYEVASLLIHDQLIVEKHDPARLELPVMMCQNCSSILVKLISKSTRDAWDQFVEEHFDGPPGISLDSPQFDPILL